MRYPAIHRGLAHGNSRPIRGMYRMTGLWPVLFCLGFGLLVSTLVRADPSSAAPAISIVIDDLGKTLGPGKRVLALPGPVACAFLPHQRFTPVLAEAAYRGSKEVLLHLPMDSVDGRRLDAGAVTLDMTERQFAQVVQESLASVPFAVGINNHMGSLLTRHPGHMLWLMQAMRREGPLLFVDSRTTAATVARRLAVENDVPSLDRDVFLDHSLLEVDIAFQFRRLLRLARENGTALAIGHPHPQTLAYLEEQLPLLERNGIRLVSIKELISIQQQGGSHTWQASSSPSRRAVKN
ncbi:MAG: divergent polysaccharide deacetylase family protein [Thiogranum sp.]|nr:divergent polysaccharide deacetylase family protein [Thiogranum sp.]